MNFSKDLRCTQNQCYLQIEMNKFVSLFFLVLVSVDEIVKSFVSLCVIRVLFLMGGGGIINDIIFS